MKNEVVRYVVFSPGAGYWTASKLVQEGREDWAIYPVWGDKKDAARFVDELNAAMVVRCVEHMVERTAVVERIVENYTSLVEPAALVAGAYGAAVREIRNAIVGIADAYVNTSPAMTEMGKIRVEALVEVADRIARRAREHGDAEVAAIAREHEALRAVGAAAKRVRNDYAAAIAVCVTEKILEGEEFVDSKEILDDLDGALARLAEVTLRIER